LEAREERVGTERRYKKGERYVLGKKWGNSGIANKLHQKLACKTTQKEFARFYYRDNTIHTGKHKNYKSEKVS
jgi:hypothetical protein